MDTAQLPIKQKPKLVHYTHFGTDTWGVRDGRNGGESPFGPVGVTREEAEAWLADPVRVIAVAVLQDHSRSYTAYNQAGNPRCRCGAPSPSEDHIADMLAARLALAGLTRDG
ncbi:hypothetical protein [Mycobacterium sp. E1747]|uniref:hypothetical protein n=1 Tax=Mycobacterium sp. E1747 TaxID=1834128 RepID=UPI000B2DBB88|nr:hypothetical protein [Mycobacterium sp. E1747]